MSKAALAPATAVSPTVYTTHLLRGIVDQIEADLGGRAALVRSLLTVPETPETTILIRLLADPTSDRSSLAQILQMGGITVATLLEAIKSAGLVRAYLQSIQVIADKAPAVVDDVMTRAAPHYVSCATCDATGRVREDPDTPTSPERQCGVCRGKGQILILPTPKQQELALDLARLLPTKAAIVQNIDQRRSLGSGSVQDMTALIKATDDLLAHARPAPRRPALPEGAIVDGAVVSSADVAGDATDSGPDRGE